MHHCAIGSHAGGAVAFFLLPCRKACSRQGEGGYGNARNAGTYNLTGLWSTKYDITFGGTTTFAITPRVLSVSIGGNGKVYDGNLGYDGASFVLGNVVAGDASPDVRPRRGRATPAVPSPAG